MPVVTAREAIAYVEQRGWKMTRWGGGDHRVFGYPGWPRHIIVAGGLNKSLPPGTWANIRREANAPRNQKG